MALLLAPLALGFSTGTSLAAAWPTLQNGAKGENVVTFQFMLRARGYQLSVDGSFGPGTESLVKQFQSAKGLSADGVVGGQTWEAVIVAAKKGDSGPQVNALQRQLKAQGARLGETGSFDTATQDAVIAFQKKQGLSADGIVGFNTWAALVGGTPSGGGTGSGGTPEHVSATGIAWIKNFEGFSDRMYDDANDHVLAPGETANGTPTIGWGTALANSTAVARYRDKVISCAEAETLLRDELGQYEQVVRKAVTNNVIKVSLNQAQFEALVSLSFNAGVEYLPSKNANLISAINSRDPQQIDHAFGLYINSGSGSGVTEGLKIRRQKEADWYNGRTTGPVKADYNVLRGSTKTCK